MRIWRVLAMSGLAVLASYAPASAHVAHTVQPGETLWSIAAANGFTTRSFAAANGLSPEAQVIAGRTIMVPSVPEAAAALQGGPPVASAPAAGAPRPLGAYRVQPGDTLSGLAARSGVSASQIAWMNGLGPGAHLIAGTALKLPTGAPPAARQAAVQPQVQQAPPKVVPQAAPNPTPGSVNSSQIRQIAAAHGVPPSLAAAVAWQESGFNNGVVSPANARGVMQILPGTWEWIQSNLTRTRLDPSAPAENVHAGVMYLGQLMRDSGGDPATAVASYYQGGSSVRRVGLLPDTRRYVQNVMALRPRFGGD